MSIKKPLGCGTPFLYEGRPVTCGAVTHDGRLLCPRCELAGKPVKMLRK